MDPDHNEQENFWTETYREFPDIAGALLGHTDIHKADLEFQSEFFSECSKYFNGYSRCLELGAGVLRVTIGLLSYYFKKIDINDIATSLERVW